MRPKARWLAQHGGPPRWLEESDPSPPPSHCFTRRGIIVNIHRVPELLSLRRNWVPPSPPPQASVSQPHLGPRGGQQWLAGEEMGDPIPTKGQTDTLVLYVYYNPLRFRCSCRGLFSPGPCWAQMVLASLVAISGPKKPRFSRPTPTNGSRNIFARIKIITSRAIYKQEVH